MNAPEPVQTNLLKAAKRLLSMFDDPAEYGMSINLGDEKHYWDNINPFFKEIRNAIKEAERDCWNP
jgi:hypothetical protein